VVITFAEAKEIVHAAEEPGWTLGTYVIEDDGWEDATHYLKVRGVADAMGDNPYPTEERSAARAAPGFAVTDRIRIGQRVGQLLLMARG
jgi:hypothetical protein